MALKLSTGMAAELATAKKTALDGGFINIYAGTVPADADAAIGSATLLCTLTEDGDGVTGLTLDQDGHILKKPAATVWAGTNVASGTATFYRHVAVGDTGAASTTQVREQGLVGLTNAAEMTLVNVTFVASEVFSLNNYVLEQPLS